MLVWPLPPPSLQFAPHDVHVWGAVLSLPEATIATLYTLLTSDEQERAGRLYFARDQQHFIIARGVLRLLLSRYTNVPPQHLRFCYGTHGKPALIPEHGGTLWHFNLSHSGGVALYAITRQRQVGVDVERIRPEFAAADNIAERFFSPQEVAALRALPRTAQIAAFFACWSRKEAYIKARGLGLALPLESFDVSLTPGAPAALLATRDDPAEAGRWRLATLTPASGYAAALAVAGQDWQASCWRWTPALAF